MAWIGLGANLGDVQATLRQTVQDLGAMPLTELVRCSSFYKTAPLEGAPSVHTQALQEIPTEIPVYCNAVVMLRTQLPGPCLLAFLQQLENASGRQRPYRYAPRTLDLDLLLYGHAVMFSPQLQLPHPRMQERAFVLHPLAEISAELVTTEQLQAVANQTIERMVDL